MAEANLPPAPAPDGTYPVPDANNPFADPQFYLFPAEAATFEAEKAEASISRLYGGIHYRSDIEMGNSHGRRIAGYTIRFARLDGADR